MKLEKKLASGVKVSNELYALVKDKFKGTSGDKDK